jgi:putative heme-binding domain-containing protein
MTGFLKPPPLCGRAPLATFVILLSSLTLILMTSTPQRAAEEEGDRLKIRRGDHICIIGNTLADRMQHDGWLEAYFQSRFPRHRLVFRDLGFSGDELTVRLRCQGFGTPDQWLTINKADVVLAFFGYNESFGGAEGLPKFKKDLDSFIKSTLAQKYNGKSAPRLVLFSPIAHENLRDRNLPDGSANNKRLTHYTEAMAEIARSNKVPFVDLFKATRALYSADAGPLTINGVHLNEHGNHELAKIVDKAMFAKGMERDAKALERIRQAVLDKNFYWFNRYRTLDGFNVYGGRADLRYTEGISNREVMQREMEVLDVMTANRDKRIWQVAQGGDLKVDDSNNPPFIPVKTNKPGTGPNGTHLFLDGEKAIQKMTVGKGMQVSLFASEKDFPELAKPVQMSFDAQGRLWVAVWPSYPHWKPKDEYNDKILILEDTKGTGKADKCTVWADHLHCPTGFEFWGGGILVTQAPGILFLKDTEGKGKADLRVRMLDGIDSADTHHTANSFTLDPGGALYFQEGVFHHSQVETPWGPPVRCANAGVFRYEPRTWKFDVYVAYGFANPHGHVFDRWGQDIVVDGTGAQPYHAALFSGHLEHPHKHPHPPQVYQQETRPCPGMEYLSSRHFPADFQGNLLVANVIGFQGILRYKIEDRGASFAGTKLEPIVFSSDPNFRPADLKVGPDGAIYFIDWQNPIIGHMQHHLRDPSRDQTHGRVYRVTYEDRPLLKPVKIAGEPIDKLLDVLKEPEDRVRYRARIELGARDTDKVIAETKKWLAGLDKSDANYEHNMLEGLWVHQYQNVVDVDLLKRMLGSKEFRARAAATRVLCYWRDRVPEALALLKKQAADPHPRVRLEAVRAASFFTAPEAIEVPLIAAERPTDIYLEYILSETTKVLDPYVKKAIADGKPIQFTSSAGARFFLKSVGTDDLLKMKRTPAVYLELLFRKGVRDEYRQEALSGLAKLEKKDPLHVLLAAIRSQDEQASGQRELADESVVFDLVRLLTSRGPAELAGIRADLENMATHAKLPVTRQLGFVVLIAADGDVDKAWKLASRSVSALKDLVRAMPLIRDPGQRASLYPRIESLLSELPAELTPKAASGKTVLGRYVRVELPGKKKTLTLAEVEVYSDGRNIARRGKASQKNTAYGGEASRAIDGKRSGKFGDGGQTHTWENTPDPWWEVDLGAEQPITGITIYNRTDGGFGDRLKGFTLKVLDGSRSVVFEKKKLPAPVGHASYEVGREDPGVVRRAAMTALTSVRGKEEAAFKALAAFVRKDVDRHAAIQALLRIRVSFWPKDEARPLLDTLLAYIRKAPAQERTTPALLDAMQLADSLATLLPLDEAKKARKELGELGVRVLRLQTLPEQMLYDKERLVVKAGKPVEIVFENTDLMPHNFVIAQPGALEEIGLQAEATATDPGAMQRHYVPANKKILLASRLLQPRDVQKLSFTAPTRPGVYPYVCTYPGHWRRMFGALYVVADLDEYLADPEAYLAKNPLPPQDALLKFNRPRKEWKLEELAAEIKDLSHGRSFANGKQMFQVATCVACHKLNGAGTEIGPDLTKLDPKLTHVDILRDILEPSFKINEKYQSYIFETTKGKQVTGLILQETKEFVKVIENPLAKAEPVILKVSEIAERKKSPTSLMPKGLLDKLTKDEILDLLAYVIARGDQKHQLFQGAHEHKH